MIEDIFMMGGGLVGFAIVGFVILWFFLWFFLPFAVFGIKDRLDKLIEAQNKLIKAQKKTNTLLERILKDPRAE